MNDGIGNGKPDADADNADNGLKKPDDNGPKKPDADADNGLK